MYNTKPSQSVSSRLCLGSLVVQPLQLAVYPLQQSQLSELSKSQGSSAMGSHSVMANRLDQGVCVCVCMESHDDGIVCLPFLIDPFTIMM